MTDEPKLVYGMDELDELRDLVEGKPEAWPQPRERSEPASDDYKAKGRQLLAMASVLSETSAAGLAERTSHGKAGASLLVSHGASTEAQIAWTLKHFRKLDKDDHPMATTEQDRYEEAERIFMAAKYRRRPKPDCQTAEGRLEVGRAALDVDPKLVAYFYGYSLSHVYRMRAEAERVAKAAA